MIGRLPERVAHYRSDGRRTLRSESAARAPGPAEVVVEVAGSAIGAHPGREVAGRVIAAGEAATEWLGRRVVVPRLLPCGECPRCRRGRTARCTAAAARGGVASHETVPARYLLSVEPPLCPPGDEPEARVLAQLAALADAAAAPYGAIVRAQVAPGDLCAVLGGGARGRFACAIARAKGAFPVVVDAQPRRRQAALAAGARAALDADDPETLRKRLFAEAAAAGVNATELKVIETTATVAGRRRAAELLAEGGTGALLADGDQEDAPLPLASLAASEAALLGAGACHPDLYPELMALVVRGELRIGPEVILLPFDELAAAEQALREGRTIALPILVPVDAGADPAPSAG